MSDNITNQITYPSIRPTDTTSIRRLRSDRLLQRRVTRSTSASSSSSSSSSNTAAAVAAVAAAVFNHNNRPSASNCPTTGSTHSSRRRRPAEPPDTDDPTNRPPTPKREYTPRLPQTNIGHNRLRQELHQLIDRPLNGIVVGTRGDRLNQWLAVISGPPGTPYVDGLFFVPITFPKDYPFRPPKLRFITKIYHTCVSFNGDVRLTALTNWRPTCNVSQVLTELYGLFSYQTDNVGLAMVPQLAVQFNDDPVEFYRIASEWTVRFASAC